MEKEREAISRFLAACDKLVSGTYLEAGDHIKEALKALAESTELRALFSEVMQEVDYSSVKASCLKEEEGTGVLYLPAKRMELFVLVFGLLVELDAGNLRLNEFLLRYFYIDGSYTASYSAFSDRMLRPFRDIVQEAYPSCHPSATERDARDVMGRFTEKLSQERARIRKLDLNEEAAAAADRILEAVASHVDEKELVLALLSGYKYFLKSVNGECEHTRQLLILAEGL